MRRKRRRISSLSFDHLGNSWGTGAFPKRAVGPYKSSTMDERIFRTTNVLERSHYALKAALDRKLGLMGTVGFLCEQVQINHARLDRINNGTCPSGSL